MKSNTQKIELMFSVDSQGKSLFPAEMYPFNVVGIKQEGKVYVRTGEGQSSRYFSGDDIHSLTCLSCGNPAQASEFTLRASIEARRALGIALEVDRFRYPSCDCAQAVLDYCESHASAACLA